MPLFSFRAHLRSWTREIALEPKGAADVGAGHRTLIIAPSSLIDIQIDVDIRIIAFKQAHQGKPQPPDMAVI
jgi:hypothetical protein